MKLTLRNSNIKDLDNIYQLQLECFNQSDRWYKSIISQYLNNGLVIENNNKEIIGVLLQGKILPCDEHDNFIHTDDIGKEFFTNNMHLKELYGIVMICIHSNFRCKGLAQKLINKHFDINKEKLLCLNTRNDNKEAINLYIKMGYLNIGLIKDKYFFPNEDSKFMIKM